MFSYFIHLKLQSSAPCCRYEPACVQCGTPGPGLQTNLRCRRAYQHLARRGPVAGEDAIHRPQGHPHHRGRRVHREVTSRPSRGQQRAVAGQSDHAAAAQDPGLQVRRILLPELGLSPLPDFAWGGSLTKVDCCCLSDVETM